MRLLSFMGQFTENYYPVVAMKRDSASFDTANIGDAKERKENKYHAKAQSSQRMFLLLNLFKYLDIAVYLHDGAGDDQPVRQAGVGGHLSVLLCLCKAYGPAGAANVGFAMTKRIYFKNHPGK